MLYVKLTKLGKSEFNHYVANFHTVTHKCLENVIHQIWLKLEKWLLGRKRFRLYLMLKSNMVKKTCPLKFTKISYILTTINDIISTVKSNITSRVLKSKF